MKARLPIKSVRSRARAPGSTPHLAPTQVTEPPQTARPFDYSIQQNLKHIPILAADSVTTQRETAALHSERAIDGENAANRPNASDWSLANIAITRNSQQPMYGDTTNEPERPGSLSQRGIIQRKVVEHMHSRQNATGLPYHLKTGIESFSGLSLDDVQVHYNSSKPARMDALAYTQGRDIYMGPRQEKHLAHEAWHVVQQKLGLVQPVLGTQGVGITDDQRLEREADVMGARALQTPSAGLMHPIHASPTSLHSGIAPIQAMRIRRANGEEANVPDDYQLKEGEDQILSTQQSEVTTTTQSKRSRDTEASGEVKKQKSDSISLVNYDSEPEETQKTGNPVSLVNYDSEPEENQIPSKIPVVPPTYSTPGTDKFLSTSNPFQPGKQPPLSGPLPYSYQTTPTDPSPYSYQPPLKQVSASEVPASQPPTKSGGFSNKDFQAMLANSKATTTSPISQLQAQLNRASTLKDAIQTLYDAAKTAKNAQDLLAIAQFVGGKSSHAKGFRGLQDRFNDDRFTQKHKGHAYAEKQTLTLYQYIVKLYRERYKQEIPGSQDIIEEARKRGFHKDPPDDSSEDRGSATKAPRARLDTRQ